MTDAIAGKNAKNTTDRKGRDLAKVAVVMALRIFASIAVARIIRLTKAGTG